MKMRALRHLRYPRGPNSRTYEKGDVVEVLTEKDAKALRLMRIAEPMKDKPVPITQAPSQRYQTTAAVAEATASDDAPKRYQRRDMRAED